eukprot:502664-Pyramimonas_sp.AAC.1
MWDLRARWAGACARDSERHGGAPAPWGPMANAPRRSNCPRGTWSKLPPSTPASPGRACAAVPTRMSDAIWANRDGTAESKTPCPSEGALTRSSGPPPHRGAARGAAQPARPGNNALNRRRSRSARAK